jgi:tetraacyldisaccharide 4'-kinase
VSPDEPEWWYPPDGKRPWQARVLAPAGAVWGAATARRMAQPPLYRSRFPVICVGNFTAGGTGKTPLCLHIASALKDRGAAPVFLTRGYGSDAKAPRWVDADRDTAADVGDEPLLLARAAPVMVSRDRAAGAKAIEASDVTASVIIMDDGLQNPSLAKDLTIAVVDGARGFGNGAVVPAGPLRAPLASQTGHVDAIVLNGAPRGGAATDLSDFVVTGFSGPVVFARAEPAIDPGELAGARVSAFCGIGNPARFYSLLGDLGADVVGRRSFPDHHEYTAAEALALLVQAERSNSRLITTEKDAVRLNGFSDARGELREASAVLPIKMAFARADADQLAALIHRAIARER